MHRKTCYKAGRRESKSSSQRDDHLRPQKSDTKGKCFAGQAERRQPEDAADSRREVFLGEASFPTLGFSPIPTAASQWRVELLGEKGSWSCLAPSCPLLGCPRVQDPCPAAVLLGAFPSLVGLCPHLAMLQPEPAQSSSVLACAEVAVCTALPSHAFPCARPAPGV